MKERKLNYSLFAMFFEIIWVVISIAIFGYLFSILKLIEKGKPLPVYDILSYRNVPQGTVNLVMSLCIFVLIVSIPLLVINLKNYRNLQKKAFNRENGIYQVCAGILSLVVLNIPACILYILSGKEILKEHPKVKIEYENEDLDPNRHNFRHIIVRIITFALIIFFALIIIIPFYWMIVSSLMSRKAYDDFDSMSFFISLKDMYWVNIKEAFTAENFKLYISNTLIVAFWTTVGTVITTILAAFAFARIEFKGRDFLFSLFLMTMMVPGELYVLTNYVTVSNTFDWYNTFYAMVVPFMASIFYIFFLRQTFKQVPDSLYRAAKVDGCSDFKFLTRVMIPIAIPTLITITILSALGTWNAYVWPSLVSNQDHWLVSIALRRSFIDPDTMRPDFRLQMAAAMLITAPILIFFLFARKYIMSGVGRSGTKG